MLRMHNKEIQTTTQFCKRTVQTTLTPQVYWIPLQREADKLSSTVVPETWVKSNIPHIFPLFIPCRTASLILSTSWGSCMFLYPTAPLWQNYPVTPVSKPSNESFKNFTGAGLTEMMSYCNRDWHGFYTDPIKKNPRGKEHNVGLCRWISARLDLWIICLVPWGKTVFPGTHHTSRLSAKCDIK